MNSFVQVCAFMSIEWCPEPESNRHGRFKSRRILSPLCLPISPPGRMEINTKEDVLIFMLEAGARI